MAHVFISHSKQDVEFVRYLKTLLEQQGIPVWLDESRLTPSTRWWNEIETSIDTCGALIVVMSPNGKESDWVEREVLLAEQLKKPIFPVLLAGSPWSRLANIQFADMRTGLRASVPASLLDGLIRHCGIVAAQPNSASGIVLTIQQGDITQIESDVIALKYARKFHGADWVVAQTLINSADIPADHLRPDEDAHTLVSSGGAVVPKQVLFVGTVARIHFDYKAVRRLATTTLAALAKALPNAEHMTTTVHGVGFGLDESEVMRAQFAGYLDAIDAGRYPAALKRITIVERVEAREERLRRALDENMRGQTAFSPAPNGWGYVIPTHFSEYDPNPDLYEVAQITSAGQDKPYVYVALPPLPQMEDLFYYGIQGAVHAAGLLCLRDEDDTANIIDSPEVSLQKIDAARLVIADVTHLDPEVMLRVGYALGKSRPVVIIGSPPPDSLRLEQVTRIAYGSIKSLENGLTAHLQPT
jgi:hypothetical protein